MTSLIDIKESDPIPEPICNIEAEQGLLGALLNSNQLLYHFAFLSEHDFYEPVHQRIFEEIIRLINSGEKADAILLMPLFSADEALRGLEGKYLPRLVANAASMLDAIAYAKEIKRYAIMRHIAAVMIEAQIKLREGNPHETAAFITSQMLKITEGVYGNPAKTDAKITEEILEGLQRDLQPFPSGITKLDGAMEGGFYPGKAYGFCGRKKMGKTMLAATISYNLAKQKTKHLFICAEMGPHEIHQRQLARELDVYPSAFRTDFKNNFVFQRNLANAARTATKFLIYQNAPNLTFDQLKMYVSRGINNYGIKGFILDYWQLVGGKSGKQSDAAHLDEVAQWIANICRQHDIWALVTAQINQEGNTRGGEGIRLAFDQVYHLKAPEDDPSLSGRYLEMMDTRYTPWCNIGTESAPGFRLQEKGLFFEEIN